MNRREWHRKSDSFAMQYPNGIQNGDCDLDAVLPVFMEEREVRRMVVFSGKRHKGSVSEDNPYTMELSTDQLNSPGVLKIFGPSIGPGVEYKSVLASYRSTAPELVKQALERYGISSSLYAEYVLCDVVGIANDTATATKTNNKQSIPKWKNLCSRNLSDSDRPLLLQNFWRPCEGTSRRYEIRKVDELANVLNDDDTYGLNENARKISMAKLRRGAIPFFSPCSSNEFVGYDDQLDLGDNYHQSNSTLKRQRKESQKLINNLNLDITRNITRPVSVMSAPNKFTSLLGPATRPFLLTVRGYDTNNDLIYYTLDDKKTTICNSQTNISSLSSIQLFAPDIHPEHCHIILKRLQQTKEGNLNFNFCLEIECSLVANLKVNGYSVVGNITINPGDLLSIGSHYMFLFKDLTAGSDIPHELSWLSSDDIGDSIVDRRQSDIRRRQNVMHVPPLMLDSNADDAVSVCSIASTATEVQREKFRFAYSLEKEDDLVRSIGDIVRQQNIDFPLAPSFLYSMCIQYSCVRCDKRQTRNLLLKILTVIRDNVSVSKVFVNVITFLY